jgi:uncharacterized sporulation protein YeaH/YhbH (DUF444 family)
MLDVLATRRVDEDYNDFVDVYSGKTRKELGKYINNGSIWKLRGKNGRLRMTIPRIDIPHIVRGKEQEGIGRGPGGKGDVIGKDDEDGQGSKAGQEESEGVTVEVSMDEVLKLLKDELDLPNLKPKPQEIYEEKKIKYNDIALQGPESLRHNRRTMLQALKRMCASGEINQLHEIPGSPDPMRLITPINSDRRYRQYREINIPSSNAVIFFARDGSGSMDQYKCDIVSDMAWWIDIWIRHFYKRTERVYIWHDTIAQEVDENKFYRYRYGGGTTCSSALKLISKQFEARFLPEKWNIYVFYFTDGENWGEDNKVFCETIKNEFPNHVVNMVGITQILPWSSQDSLKQYVDENLKDCDNLKTTAIGMEEAKSRTHMASGYYSTPQLSEEERNKQITKAILNLLGKIKVKNQSY